MTWKYLLIIEEQRQPQHHTELLLSTKCENIVLESNYTINYVRRGHLGRLTEFYNFYYFRSSQFANRAFENTQDVAAAFGTSISTSSHSVCTAPAGHSVATGQKCRIVVLHRIANTASCTSFEFQINSFEILLLQSKSSCYLHPRYQLGST